MLQNPKLQRAFANAITEGLRAATTIDAAKWACRYRVMTSGSFKGPWSFEHFPWLKAMHTTRNQYCYGKKSAQMGFTECCLNVTFFTLDQLKRDVLYILPAMKPEASDFSSSRFDVALESSPYIAQMFGDVKNIGLKRAGAQSLYIRGSRSRSSLKSLPVAAVFLDEYEEFFSGALELVMERMSGQLSKQLWVISTPMVPNNGIDALYNESNQQHFMFHCPCCNRITELIFPDCLVIPTDNLSDPKIKNTQLLCKECKHQLDHLTKSIWLKEGYWEQFAPSNSPDGFYINQLYSATIEPWELATAYLKSKIDSAAEQEFYNSKLGLAHLVSDAIVTDSQLQQAMRDYVLGDPRFMSQSNMITTMGVDVGSELHYTVMQYQIDNTIISTDINYRSKGRIIGVGTVKSFDELKPIILHYQPSRLACDDMPDTRAALAFIRQFQPGFGSLVHYGMNAAGQEILDHGERVTCNRTTWIDVALGRFFNGKIIIPKNLPHEYKEHIKHLVKVYTHNKDGQAVAQYKKCGEDHYGHSLTYAEIALKLAFAQGSGIQNMTERVI